MSDSAIRPTRGHRPADKVDRASDLEAEQAAVEVKHQPSNANDGLDNPVGGPLPTAATPFDGPLGALRADLSDDEKKQLLDSAQQAWTSGTALDLRLTEGLAPGPPLEVCGFAREADG